MSEFCSLREKLFKNMCQHDYSTHKIPLLLYMTATINIQKLYYYHKMTTGIHALPNNVFWGNNYYSFQRRNINIEVNYTNQIIRKTNGHPPQQT